MRSLWIAALLLAAFAAHATQNLPVVCSDTTKAGQQVGKCTSSSQTMTAAGDASLVRNCPNANCTNATAENVWRKLSDVPANTFVEVCTIDKPDPSPVNAGSCQTEAGTWGGMRWVLPAVVAREGGTQGSFTATPSSGTAPLQLTLSWAIPQATSCTASGSWSGTKAAAGSQVITGLTASARYTLSCERTVSDQTTGNAKLAWTPPTQNSDGSVITNLAGFRLYHGVAESNLVTTVQLADPSATTYTFSGLPLGTRYFALRSYNTAGVESVVLSNVASKNITPSSVSTPVFNQSIDVKVTVQVTPNPPTGLTVE